MNVYHTTWYDATLSFGKQFGRGMVIEFDATMTGIGIGICFSTGTFFLCIPFCLITGRWRNA